MLVYGNFIFRLTNGVVLTQGVSLSILASTLKIYKSNELNGGFSKEAIIVQVVDNSSKKLLFTEKEMNYFYDFAIKFRNGSINQEQLIFQLWGVAMENWVGGFGIILAMIIAINNASGFQILPPDLQWLYGNNQLPSNFRLSKENRRPRSITVMGLTQNASSEENSSSGSWDYQEVMQKLKHYEAKQKIVIHVDDERYPFKAPYTQSAYEFSDQLAGKICDSTRKSDTDVHNRAQNYYDGNR